MSANRQLEREARVLEMERAYRAEFQVNNDKRNDKTSVKKKKNAMGKLFDVRPSSVQLLVTN